MDKISTTKERILQYVDFQGITKTQFHKEVGIAPSNFKGDGKVSDIGSKQLAKVLRYFPRLNARWLITGEGEMEILMPSGMTHNIISGSNNEVNTLSGGSSLSIKKNNDELKTEIKYLKKIIKQQEQIINLKNEEINRYTKH